LPLPTSRESETDALAAAAVQKRKTDATVDSSGVCDDMLPSGKAQTGAAACAPVTTGLPCPAGRTPCPQAAVPPLLKPYVREATSLPAAPTGAGGDTCRRRPKR